MEDVAVELEQYDPAHFAGIQKKTVRDRVHLLLDQHKRQENFARKQSRTSEEFKEKNQLLTDLSELWAERDTMAQKQREEQQAELAPAVQMRDDACGQLSKKSKRKGADVGDKDDNDDEDENPDLGPASNPTTPTTPKAPAKKRTYGKCLEDSTDAMLDYLKAKSKEQASLEKERLELERRKLDLEESERCRRAEQEKEDKEERKKKQEDDRAERLAVLNILSHLADKLK